MAKIHSLPKYQALFHDLERDIVSGQYKPGERLPSEADLVKRFGVSRITAGRAMRDLRQLGLVERRAGSGTYVRAARSNEEGLFFGLLIPDLGHTEIFEPICQGMAEAPEAGEHALVWGHAKSADPKDRARQLCEQYVTRKVSGVFFAPLDIPPEGTTQGAADLTNAQILGALDEARIPVVLLDRDSVPYPARSEYDLVGIDNWRTSFLATRHLIGCGARRIAFLSSFHRTASSVEERIAGYREALFAHGLSVEHELIPHLNAEDEIVVQFLMNTVKPDGFVCANDVTAGRLMHSLLAVGIRIPDEVRVVGMDDVAYASLLPVPLTTMHQPCRELGMAAMSMMLERIRRPGMPPRHVLLDCPLVVRKSCGAS